MRIFDPGAGDRVAIAEDDGLATPYGLHNDRVFTGARETVRGGHHLDDNVFDVDLVAGVAVDMRYPGHGPGVIIGGRVVAVVDLVAGVGIIDVDAGVRGGGVGRIGFAGAGRKGGRAVKVVLPQQCVQAV